MPRGWGSPRLPARKKARSYTGQAQSPEGLSADLLGPIEHPVWKDDDRAGFREDGWAQRAQSRGARDIDSGDIPQTQRGGGCLTMPRIEVAKLFYKWADTFAGRVDRPPANRRRRART